MILAGFAVLFISPCVGFAVPFNIAGPPQPDYLNLIGNPASISFNVVQTGSITDLNLNVQIQSLVADENSIELTHNAVTVLVRPIDLVAFGDLNLTFDDEAAVSYLGQLSGTVTPANPLSAFDGMELSGTWTLRLTNIDFAEADNLIAWSLIGTTAEVAALPEPATMAFGLLSSTALALRRRRTV